MSGARKLLFWLWCDPATLRTRLDERVDEMVSRGLEAEVRTMRSIAQRLPEGSNYQSGIFQTIRLSTVRGVSRPSRHLPDPALCGRAEAMVRKSGRGHQNVYAPVCQIAAQVVQNKLVPEVRRAQATGAE